MTPYTKINSMAVEVVQVEHLPSRHGDLGLIPNTIRRKNQFQID
jgi:hypothetical protein